MSGLLSIASGEAPTLCSRIGHLESGSVSIAPRERVSAMKMDLTFAVKACRDSSDQEATVRLQADDVEIWRVAGIVGFLGLDKLSSELAAELRAWAGQPTAASD